MTGEWEGGVQEFFRMKIDLLPQAYLKFVSNLHTKSQLSYSIWKGDKRGKAIFKVKNEENLLFFPLNRGLRRGKRVRGCFDYVPQFFIF